MIPLRKFGWLILPILLIGSVAAIYLYSNWPPAKYVQEQDQLTIPEYPNLICHKIKENAEFETSDPAGALTVYGEVITCEESFTVEEADIVIAFYQNYFEDQGWEYYLQADFAGGRSAGWKKGNRYFIIDSNLKNYDDPSRGRFLRISQN